MNKIIRFLFSLSNELKQLIVISIDFLIVFFSLWSSLSLRYESFNFPFNESLYFYILIILIALPVFYFFDLYRNVHRYTDLYYIQQIIRAFFIYTIIYIIVFFIYKFYFEYQFFGKVMIPFSIVIIQPIVLLFLLLISRMTYKFILNQNPIIKSNINIRNILIYGADAEAVKMARIINANPKYKLIAYIDEDRKFYKRTIDTIKVYGMSEIETLKNKFNITDIILAFTKGEETKRQIIEKLENYNLRIRKISHFVEQADDNRFEIEELNIDELLGRDIVPHDQDLLQKNISGKNILISGAGGSIGSEIARKVLRLKPNLIILYELNEFSLYNVDKELSTLIINENLKVKIFPILGDICNEAYLDILISKYSINSIFHAAAYKHVTLVEKNPIAAIQNNIFGTLAICKSAIRGRVCSFTLISTDKAVNPESVMGKTKRVAEIIVKSISENDENNFSTFSMVRFGNVLNSTGSVVPLFRNQIKNGGPITVTHMEVSRYFMTISEAALLVIQAAAMAKTGQLFILDMGKPIKIIDLARRMIKLSGLKVKDNENIDGDIEIKYVGLSKGEKLHEKLIHYDDTYNTDHPKIFSAKDDYIEWHDLDKNLNKLKNEVSGENIDQSIKCIDEIIKC